MPETEVVEEKTEVKAEKTDDQSVPYSRFKEVNDAKAAAEKAAEAATAALKEREEADLSEKEKAEKLATEATARAEAAEARATNLERSALVRNAASGFNDPDDAVAMLDLSDIDSAEKAKKAVENLGKSKPHLVKTEKPTPIGSTLTPNEPGEIPTGADGKPDMKAGLGNELLAGVFGNRG